MSAWVNILFALLIILGYVVAPLMLVWGWVRWADRPKTRTACSILSMTGFIFASASATLAILSVGYAEITHGFPFYDPRLLRIFRWGILLSLSGLLFGVSGIWRHNSLRWHAPVSALGMLAFWIVAASGE